jgi:hypothetical protein
MHCLKLRHALLAGDRSSSAAIASTIGYSNHPVSNVLDQRTFYLSLLRLVIATIPPGRSPPSRKAVSHPRTIWGDFTRNSASQSLAARQCRTRHSYGWTPMPKRTFTGAAGVSPPWFVIPTLHRKIEHRSATDERTFTGAAGVSPPWLWETRLRRYKRDCSPNRRRCMCGSPLHSR